MKDYYKILGISENADPELIKKNFRKLALKFHPDRNPGEDSEKKFKELNEAYSVLSNPEQRSQYDVQRRNPFGHGQNANPFHGGFGDVWSEFFGDFGDIFGSAGPSQRSKRTTNNNPNIRFEIPLSELVSGEINQVFEHNEIVDCNPCGGAGGFNVSACQRCHGAGEVRIVHQAGTMRIQSNVTCDLCMGLGKSFEKVCETCGGSGANSKNKKYRIRIKTELV